MSTRTKFLARSALIVAAAILAQAPAAQAASARDHVVTRTVRYTDLDVSRPAGAGSLYARISNAATAVCGGRQYTTLDGQRRYEKCRREAIEDAVRRVDRLTLSQLHSQRTLLASR